MGLINETGLVKMNGVNTKHYENLGYIIPKKKHSQRKNILVYDTTNPILVKIEDLLDNSHALVNIECDDCGRKIENVIWQAYKRYVGENGVYYCQKCANKLFRRPTYKKTKLKNSKSFEQWCIENNKQDILLRWDYELNDCKHSEITYGVDKKYYFKCPMGIHKSELKQINCLTSGQEGSMDCKLCNSFAQWGIDNLGVDFFEKYWDCEKNTINPWDISKCNNTRKVWIRCQEKKYHNNYDISCYRFIMGDRCSYCSKRGGKVHSLDSLGTLFPKSLELWSDKNKKSPYEYAPKSDKEVYWKCPNGKHDDYIRDICNSNKCDFRCPECAYSKGEERISNYFINKNINYIPQKEFDGLVGLNNGLLSYDFYLPEYGLIEYQGEQHERYIKGFHKSKKDFEKQLEHDRRKRQYCVDNNIKLLEIWYYDFDNIESILQRELNLQ